MKFKKICVFLGVFVLALCGVSVVLGEDIAPEVKSLSLSQAMEMAMKDNAEVELAALGVEKAALAVDKAEFAKDKMLDHVDNPDQDATMVIDVAPAQANSGKIVADTAKAYTENSIKYRVESAYYGVLKAEKNLEVAQSSYQRAEKQEIQAEAKFKVGTVAKIDVISAEAQLQSAAASLNDAKAGVEKAKMSFNKAVGLNLDTPVKLTDKFTFAASQPIDVEKVFQEMHDKDLPFVTARESLNSNQVSSAYYKKYYTPNTFLYRDAAYQLKGAEVNFDTAESNLQLNIKTDYLDLKTAEGNYHVYSKSLEQAKEAYRLTRLQYDVGLSTSYNVLSAEDDYKQAELGLLNALYSYNLAKAKFTYGIF